MYDDIELALECERAGEEGIEWELTEDILQHFSQVQNECISERKRVKVIFLKKRM